MNSVRQANKWFARNSVQKLKLFPLSDPSATNDMECGNDISVPLAQKFLTITKAGIQQTDFTTGIQDASGRVCMLLVENR
jgi:hypothetical protein